MYRCLGKNYPNKTGCFHKALPNVRSAYVTLQDFTPDLQKIYTDIFAISVTFRNSASTYSMEILQLRQYIGKFLSLKYFNAWPIQDSFSFSEKVEIFRKYFIFQY